jgi:two-component system NtrC family sensor kinase
MCGAAGGTPLDSVKADTRSRMITGSPLSDSITVSSIATGSTAGATAPRHDRHTTAGSPRFRLGTRLAALVALSVAGVVGAMTVAGVRLAARQMESELRETARVTAVAVADDLELARAPMNGDDLVPVLRDYMTAAFDLYSISVFRSEGGTAVPLASTSIATPPLTSLVERVIVSGEESWSSITPHLALIAVPVKRGSDVGAVAVAVSLAGVERVQRWATFVGTASALVAIALLTLLIHLVMHRLVLEPLHEIVSVIDEARAGNLNARVRPSRDDEMRQVAEGLNTMLAELGDLHRSLNERVTAATDSLRERNEQLVHSYQSILQLRDAAGRAQQLAAVGQTVANVAHQVGTPLNLVSGHVQLLLQETADPALRRRLSIVQEQVERVASTVRALLARAGQQVEQRPVSVTSMLRRIGEVMRWRLDAAHVRLDLQLDEGVPDVLADETQLELAMLNLVTNALDAMPDGGTLTMCAARSGEGGVTVSIHDSGTGIAPEVMQTLFDPWVTTKRPGQGTGLGLSIARDVVASLGGTISVASEPGRGATFTLELPAAAGAAQA